MFYSVLFSLYIKSRGLGQAVFGGFGLAWHLRKPKPPQARPKPGLSGQAVPEKHYDYI